jgi:hypothetical protein
VHARGDGFGVGVAIETEEGAEGEVLHDGELGKDFGVVHFDHALSVKSTSCILLPSDRLDAEN